MDTQNPLINEKQSLSEQTNQNTTAIASYSFDYNFPREKYLLQAMFTQLMFSS